MIQIEEISEKIKEAILLSGMTQAELAEKIGVKQQTVSCYLHKNALPSL